MAFRYFSAWFVLLLLLSVPLSPALAQTAAAPVYGARLEGYEYPWPVQQ